MRLYDTLSRSTQEVRPREGRLGMYVCGITPYDGGHLGHAFTYHTYDVIARRLRRQGVIVRSVRNVTDVDDDILRVARLRGVDYRQLGDEQVARFDADMRDLNLLEVDAEPRATSHVGEMVDWVARLVDSGSAYAIDGWVYFNVTTFPRYGALSGLDASTMTVLSAERGADPNDPRKRSPLDFVLWQPSVDDEPRWPSPWSAGRPGWHIECSVLSTGELGVPVDIHGGGDDLIYPHHESEIAQVEAISAGAYVTHWVHVAMVRFQGDKMSKSLGNLVFVRDLLERLPAATVRLLLAAHHYRTTWEYDDDQLADAIARERSYAAALHIRTPVAAAAATALREQFLARVDDDLDTPGALAKIDGAVARWHDGSDLGGPAAVPVAALLTDLLGLLGVELAGSSAS